MIEQILSIIRKYLSDPQFWGEITIKIEKGKVVLIRKVENLKP